MLQQRIRQASLHRARLDFLEESRID
jgi:hypothetical protein